MGCVQKPSLKTQDTIKPFPLLLLFAFAFCHRVLTLLFTSFFFNLFYFPLRVSCSQFKFNLSLWPPQNFYQPQLRIFSQEPTPNHWLPKTSLQRLLNIQPISNLGKLLSAKRTTKGNPLATQASTTPDFCWAGAFNINFSLIEKLNARVY